MTRYEMGPCPACASTSSHAFADSNDIRTEMEQLWAFHTRRLRSDTPADRLHDRVAFSQDPALRIARCDTCGLLYRNPRERADDLVDTYEGEKLDDAAMDALFDNQKTSYSTQAARLLDVVGHTGTGLEIGSYVGAFLAAARDSGWTFTGLDVNQAAISYARSRGFNVRTGTIDDIPPDLHYDVVAFWNCFDQLPDPRAAAFAARRLLPDGGTIAIRVPNGDFYARWRQLLHSPLRLIPRALLAHNNLLAFPYRHGFTIASLRALLQATGFEVAREFGDTLVPVADEWTRSWAAAEERLLKASLRILPPRHAPWIEVYAHAV